MSDPTPPISLTARRLPGIDALRVWGTLLVVLLHAGVPYIPEPMPGLFWPVDNVDGSPAVAAVLWSIESFIMPLFFAVSGVSAAILLQRKGADVLLRNRWDRILKPLLIVGPFILLAEFYIWNLGDAIRGNLPWMRLTRFSAKAYNPEVWGTAHLWYLEYLFLYSLMVWGFCRLRRGGTGSSPASETRRFALPPALLILLIALVAGLILDHFPEIVTSFDHRFWPVPKRFAYFAIYFFGGMLLIPSVERSPSQAKLIGYALLALGIASLPSTVTAIRQLLQGEDVSHFWVAATLLVSALGLGVGSTIVSLFTDRGGSPAMKYGNEASYWVYIIHHPLCGGVHLLLDRTILSAGAKFAVASLLVLALSLGSYQLCVRNTRLEVLLNGRKSSEK